MGHRTGGIGRREEEQMERRGQLDPHGHVEDAAVAEQRRIERREGIVLGPCVSGQVPADDLVAVPERLAQAGDQDAVRNSGRGRELGRILAVHEDERGPLCVAEDERRDLLA